MKNKGFLSVGEGVSYEAKQPVQHPIVGSPFVGVGRLGMFPIFVAGGWSAKAFDCCLIHNQLDPYGSSCI